MSTIFDVAATAANETQPSAASSPDGRTTLAFLREEPLPGLHQLYTREVDARARGVACSGDLECASGFCSAGVCCESRCEGACERCSTTGRCEPRPAGAVCRGATGVCDAVETCDGLASSCPRDAVRPDDSVCDDGREDTVEDHCVAGACVGLGPSICLDPPCPPAGPKGCGCGHAGALPAALGALVLLVWRQTARRRHRAVT